MNPWTKRSEKEPENQSYVLCCREGELPHVAYFYDGKFTDAYSHWTKWEYVGITHWMKLPKAPI